MLLASLVSGVNIEASCRATQKAPVWEVWVPSSFNLKPGEFSYVHLHVKEAP